MSNLSSFRKQVYRHATAILKIQSTNNRGKVSIGTGFHIGDGYVVTARHVVEKKDIEVKAHPFISSAERHGSAGFSDEPQLREYHNLKVTASILPEDEKIDLAILETDFDSDFYMGDSIVDANPKRRDHFVIENYFDEVFWEDKFLLKQYLILGFPPIPQSSEAYCVAVRAELNSVIEKYNAPGTHLILSSTARGGFSGGPVINSKGRVVAICTESLNRNKKLVELGFTAAVTIEHLNRLLCENDIFPASNLDGLSKFASQIDEIDSEREESHTFNSVILD